MVLGVNLWRTLGRPQAAADVFMRTVLAYANGRNSLDHLPVDFRARLAQDAPTLLAEVATGTGEEFTSAQLREGIKAPVALLLGEQSVSMFPAAIKQLAAIFPQAPLVRIPNGNHLTQFDQPEAFVQAVDAALGQS
jgi:pimeloyl-ACP methyl ester carboxylesterase